MKKVFFLTLLLCLAISATAKDKTIAANTHDKERLLYVQQQHLLDGTDGMTVVTLDLEWPETLNHLSSAKLHRFLCRELFGSNDSTLAVGIEHLLASKGSEVKHMPDNPTRTRYVNIMLRALVWEENKYISYRYVVKERDGASADDQRYVSHFFTYDIVNDQVYMAEDLIRDQFFPGGIYHDYLLEKVGAMMEDDVEFLEEDLPKEAFLAPEGLVVAAKNMRGQEGDRMRLVILTDAVSSAIVKHKLVKWIKSAPQERPVPRTLQVMVDDAQSPEPSEETDYVYRVVDTQPVFAQGNVDMGSFVSKHVSYPAYELIDQVKGRVVLQFIVERDGSVSQPMALRPVSPGLAREAVRVLMATPKWTPAVKNGTAVRAYCNMPINFKLE